MSAKKAAPQPKLYRCAFGSPNQMFDPAKAGGKAEQAGKYPTITQAVAAARKALESFITHCQRYDSAGLLNIEATLRQLDELHALRAEHLILDTQIDTAYDVTVRVELWRDDVEYIAPAPLVGQRKSVKMPKPKKARK